MTVRSRDRQVPIVLTSAVAAIALLGGCVGTITDRLFGSPQQPPNTITQTAPEVPVEPPVARATPPAIVEQAPEQLLGMAQPQIAELLGAPAFVRRDNGAEIWQYRNDDCVLHLFLYADPAGNAARVSYVELRETGDGKAMTSVAAQRRCLGVLVASRSVVERG